MVERAFDVIGEPTAAELDFPIQLPGGGQHVRVHMTVRQASNDAGRVATRTCRLSTTG